MRVDKMYTICLAFSLALSLSLNGLAQGILQGHVLSNEVPLQSAVVKLVKRPSQVLAFSVTNKDGLFLIKTTTNGDSLLLIVSSLGYKSEQKFLAVESSTHINNLFFNLKVQPTELSEVIVRKSQPIRISKDTTTFLVSHYKDGSERSVEDIIKKLPGLQVSTDGAITFKGKLIDKLVIEGEDFFSKNYKLISKNMPQHVVDKIDAIENYNDNPLLKNITISDKTILNIHLKEEAKNIPFGTVISGLTVKKQYELSNTFFLIKQKAKFGQLMNSNTVSFDPVSELDYTMQKPNTGIMGIIDTNPTQFGIVEPVSTMPISFNRYLANQARMGAINLSKTISPSFKIKSWIYGYNDKLTRNLNNQLIVNGLESLGEQTELIKYVQSPSLLKAYIEGDYNISSSSALKLQLSTGINQPNNWLSNSSSGSIFPNTFTNYGEISLNLLSNIEYTKKFKGNNALQLQAYYNLRKSSNTYYVFSNYHQSIFSDSTSEDKKAKQEESFFQNDMLFKAKYFKKSSITLRTISISYNQSNQRFLSSINSNLFEKLSIDTVKFYNETIYQKRFLSVEGSFSLDLGKWRMFGGGYQQIGTINYQNPLIQGSLYKTSSRKFFPSNFFSGIRYSIKGGSTIDLNISSNTALPNVFNVSEGYSLINYRTLQRGIDTIVVRRDNALLLSHSMYDPVHFLTTNLQLAVIQTSNPTVQFNTIKSGLSFIELRPINQQATVLQLNGDFDKYVHAIRTRFNATGSISQSTGFIGYNHNQIGTNRVLGTNYKISLSSAANFPVNIEAGIKSFRNEIEIAQVLPFKQHLFNEALFGLVRINSTNNYLRGNIRLERNQLRTDYSVSTLWFADLWLTYSPKKSPFTIEWIGRNILNAKSLSTLNIFNTIVTQTSYNLLQPLFEIRLECKLGVRQ